MGRVEGSGCTKRGEKRTDAVTEIRTIRYNYTHCYLIKTNEGWLMIDNDMPGTLHAMWKAVKECGVKWEEVCWLLVTHYHPDHGGLTGEIKGAERKLILLDKQVETRNEQGKYVKTHAHPFAEITMEDMVVVTEEESRAFLKSVGLDGQLLWTPGHSSDSVTLVLDSGDAFIGDLIHYEYLPMYDDEVLRASWKKVRAAGGRRVYSGHWPVYELPHEGFRNA